MNDLTPTETGTAITLPTGTTLTTLFKTENALDPIIAKLEAAARAEAQTHDASTPKGRKALRSLANTVSTRKAELDRQGKALTEEQRKEIAAVNAGRKLAEERLAALRDEIKKPAEDWDAAEELRVERHKQNLGDFDTGRVDGLSSSEDIRAMVTHIEALTTGPEWDEFQPIAEAKREQALVQLRSLLASAEHREAEAAELARLREEAEARAKKDAEEAERREAERLAAEKAEADRIAAERAEKAEAERKAQAERDRAEAAEQARKQAEEDAARREKEATDRHAREMAESKQREEAAAQRERDRIADEQRQADEARAKREADQAHRARIRNEIAEGLKTLEAGNWFALADALIDGKVPHTKVTL